MWGTFFGNSGLGERMTYEELYDVVLQALRDPSMQAPGDASTRLTVLRKLVKRTLGLSKDDANRLRDALANIIDFNQEIDQITANFQTIWHDFSAWQHTQTSLVPEKDGN
mgnify:CR=1 FL=1